MKRFLYSLVVISSADSIQKTTVNIIEGLLPIIDGPSVRARKKGMIEIDFKDDLLNNIIWFSSVGGSRNVIGLSDSGYIVSFEVSDASSVTDFTQPAPTMSPLLDSDGTPLTTEMYSSTGSVVSGDLAMSKGIYAAFTQGGIREFPQISEATGSVAKASNPIGLCDTWLSEEIATGCGESFGVMTSIKPEDDTETIGTILFACRSPRDDLSIPGWLCNPSNGDSIRFSVNTPDKTTALSAMSPCAACDPYQMFLLFSHFESAGRQKSISIESIATSFLTQEEGKGNRVTLFTLNTSDIVFLSLSVLPGTDSELTISLFGYNESSPTTAYVIMTYAVDINPSTAAKITSSSGDYSLSVFILFLLLCIGIAIPFLIRFNPHIRARIENVRWLKNAEQIGLVGDSGDESDPEDRSLGVPKKFGHRSPHPSHTPTKLKPINESDISGGS